jgi:erythromycin esterase-like protein
LPDIDDAAFAEVFDRYASARVILLGEASHGSSEFYKARAAITRRLVERHGFNIVAAEADWPDEASYDRFVRDREQPASGEAAFQRFPTWMWRNAEVAAFLTDLRQLNATRPYEQRAGFYGLDLYSLSTSIRAVLDYLDKVDPEAAKVARERYGCLTPWANEPQAYGRMAISKGYAFCETGVLKTLNALLERRLDYAAHDGEQFLDAAANARLVKNA